jgi:hypothetical protein
VCKSIIGSLELENLEATILCLPQDCFYRDLTVGCSAARDTRRQQECRGASVAVRLCRRCGGRLWQAQALHPAAPASRAAPAH